MAEFKLLRLDIAKRAMLLGTVALMAVVVTACSPGTSGSTPTTTSVPEREQVTSGNAAEEVSGPDLGLGSGSESGEAVPVGEIVVPEFNTDAFAQINPAPEIRELIREADLRGEFDYYEEERIPRDAINPVYTPKFVTPNEATLKPKELVMGLEINGDARAYPVGMMRIREIVNDEVGGTPVLVTW